MGILSWLLGKPEQKKPKQKRAESSHKPTPRSRTTARNRTLRAINIDGDCETRVFTYLGVVFNGLKKGQEIYVDVVDHDVEIHSKSTGTTIDTAEWDTVAFSYAGRICGTLGNGLEFLKEAAASGYSLQVKLRKVGMYSAGIPEFVALTLNKRVLEEWWRRQKNSPVAIPIDVEGIQRELDLQRANAYQLAVSKRVGLPLSEDSVTATVYPTRKNWLAPNIPVKSRSFEPEFELLPVKQGSQAKPHILIKENGHPLYEVSARSVKAYKTLADNIGRECKGRILPNYYDDDSEFLRIVILFESKNAAHGPDLGAAGGVA